MVLSDHSWLQGLYRVKGIECAVAACKTSAVSAVLSFFPLLRELESRYSPASAPQNNIPDPSHEVSDVISFHSIEDLLLAQATHPQPGFPPAQ